VQNPALDPEISFVRRLIGVTLFQFTRIWNDPKLTTAFSGIKFCLSFSIPIRPYPQLALIKSNTHPIFSSTLYFQYFGFLRQTYDFSKERVFRVTGSGCLFQRQQLLFNRDRRSTSRFKI
jgi:hypothetical protein